MSDSDGILGRCPNCGGEIPSAYLLIEYEATDGSLGRWAECPDCDDVVDPDA